MHGKDRKKEKKRLMNRLLYLDYLMNFMAEWPETEQKTFIEKWNKDHNDENQKLLTNDATPFKQWEKVIQWGDDLMKDFRKQIMNTQTSCTSKGLEAVYKRWINNKKSIMEDIGCIRHVSMLAYKNYISDKQKESLAKAG